MLLTDRLGRRCVGGDRGHGWGSARIRLIGTCMFGKCIHSLRGRVTVKHLCCLHYFLYLLVSWRGSAMVGSVGLCLPLDDELTRRCYSPESGLDSGETKISPVDEIRKQFVRSRVNPLPTCSKYLAIVGYITQMNRSPHCARLQVHF